MADNRIIPPATIVATFGACGCEFIIQAVTGASRLVLETDGEILRFQCKHGSVIHLAPLTGKTIPCHD